MQTYQTWYNSTLTIWLLPGVTTIHVAVAPTVTAGRIKIGLWASAEWINYTGVSWTTLTGVSRQMSTTAIPSVSLGSGSTWIAWTPIKLVAMHDQIPDINEDTEYAGVDTFVDINFTGTTTGGLRVKSLTTTQRDAISNVANGMIIYNSTTQALNQYVGWAWTTIGDTGTVTATTVVEGKSRLATGADLAAHTAGAVVVTASSAVKTSSGAADENHMPVLNAAGQLAAWFIDTQTIGLQWIEAVVDKATFILWENVTAGQSLFAEDMVTFASSTIVQTVGDFSASKRVSFVAFWAGVSNNQIALSLKKFSSPSVDLGIRIETDNAGNPSWTLVDANATQVVTAASLSWSLANTTITFPWSFTVTLWQKAHIVLYQGVYGTETVNSTNYYGVGYNSTDTTVRLISTYDGSTWSVGTAWVNATWASYSATWPVTDARGFKFTSRYFQTVTAVTRYASATVTRCRIFDSSHSVVATSTTLVGDDFQFSYGLSMNTVYYVEMDDSGGAYTQGEDVISVVNTGGISYINWTINWVNNASWFNVVSITTVAIVSPTHTLFPYYSSSLLLSTLLSLTSTAYTYKLPNDIPRIATETKSAWSHAVCTVEWFNANQSGLTRNTIYYLSDTPWAISSSVGTYIYRIGKGISSTVLEMYEKPTHIYGTVITTLNSTQGNTAATTTSSTLFAGNNYLATFNTALNPGNTSCSVNIQSSPDNSSWTTLCTANGGIAGGNAQNNSPVVTVPLVKGYYYRTNSTCGGTAAGTAASITLASIILLS